MKSLLLVLGQQAVWFACVLSAAHSMSWLGLMAAALYLGGVLYSSPDRRMELSFLFSIATIAFGLDSLLVASDQIQFADPAPFFSDYIAPPWMIALWLCFATLAPRSLSLLSGRYALAAFLGAVAGPFTYYSAMNMGAATMSSTHKLVFVGLEYALAMPLLLFLAKPLEAKMRDAEDKPSSPEPGPQ